MISGEALKKYREDSGYTIAGLAVKAKIPQKQLEEIESGTKEITPRIFNRLIKVLNIKDIEDNSWKQIVAGNVGDKIRVLREKHGYSLEQLGALADISLTYLGEIERGEKIPPISTLRAITEVFQVPVSLFIGNKRKQCIIGEKLRKARIAMGKTQRELAEETGLSAAMITQLENGKVQASLETIEQISKALGTSVCYLILEQEEVEEMIGAITPEMREILYDPKVQNVIGSICTFTKEEMLLVLNFISMIRNPYVK